MLMFAPAQNTRSLPEERITARTSGCPKRMTDQVGELDVHAEIVAVELELVARAKTGLGVHVHLHAGDVALVGDAPVAVVGGRDLEVHGGHLALLACVHHPMEFSSR